MQPLEPTSRHPLIRRYAGGFILALILMTAAALLLGRTLGTFFAGLWLCVVLLPMVVKEGEEQDIIAAGSVVDGIGVVWLVLALSDSQIGPLRWLAAYVLLLSVAMAQWGVLALLRRWITSAASAAAILLMVLWLSSPIWLLHHLQTSGRLAWMQGLIDVHPLFAMNAVVPLSIWTESPLTYRLMNLNQDVFYQLPHGPWWSIGLHVVVGAAAGLAWTIRKMKQKR